MFKQFSDSFKKFEIHLFFVLFLFAIGLRFLNLDATSLWIDEIYSMVVAMLHLSPPVMDTGIHTARDVAAYYLTWQPMRLDALIHVLENNVHMPLYYMLLNPWLGLFGTDAIGLRSFSAVFSALTLLPVFFLGRSLGGRRTAFLCLFTMAVLPSQLYYAQEGRMYALALFWACLSSLALWKILYGEKPGRWSVPYALAILGGIFSHYLFVFFLAFHAFYCLVWFLKMKDWKRFTYFLPALFVVLLAVWLWLPVYQAQKRGVEEDYHFAKGLLNQSRYLTSLVWQPIVAVTGDNTLERIFYIPLLIVLSIVACWRARFSFRREGFLVFWVLVPLLVQILYDLINQTHTIVIDRYVILISPAMALWLGCGLEKMLFCRPRFAAGAMALMVLLALANVANPSPFRDEHNKKDTRGKLLYMAHHARRGDLVVVNGPYGAAPLAAFYLSRFLPEQPMFYWVKDYRGEEQPLPDPALFKPYRRVWLFRYRTNDQRGQKEVRDVLSRLYPKLTRPDRGHWWLYSR